MVVTQDDAMTWKHCPHCKAFLVESTSHMWFPCIRGQQSGALICWLVDQAVEHTDVIWYVILSSVHVASLQWYLGAGDPRMDSNNRDMSDPLVLQINIPKLERPGYQISRVSTHFVTGSRYQNTNEKHDALCSGSTICKRFSHMI